MQISHKLFTDMWLADTITFSNSLARAMRVDKIKQVNPNSPP